MPNSLLKEAEESAIRALKYLRGEFEFDGTIRGLAEDKIIYLAYVTLNHATMKCGQALAEKDGQLPENNFRKLIK